jgi:hypothetical protein
MSRKSADHILRVSSFVRRLPRLSERAFITSPETKQKKDKQKTTTEGAPYFCIAAAAAGDSEALHTFSLSAFHGPNQVSFSWRHSLTLLSPLQNKHPRDARR